MCEWMSEIDFQRERAFVRACVREKKYVSERDISSMWLIIIREKIFDIFVVKLYFTNQLMLFHFSISQEIRIL